MGLSEPLTAAVAALGYTAPTPIQAQAIPALLEGRDLLGTAQTGTGKTAAFALPLLHHLAARPKRRTPGRPRVLVVTPTRELALQIDENVRAYAANVDLRSTAIFGGVGAAPQVERLKAGLDLLVATPGRLLDLAGQGHVVLEGLEAFVLDEADRMLDMGFLPDVRKIVALLPSRRQTLLFSATMPPDVAELANSLLRDPLRVSVVPESTTAENVVQRVIFVDRAGKKTLLAQLVADPRVSRALVFTKTKHGANRVVQQLARAKVHALAIHGNKSQGARQRALEGFRTGEVPVLVATDLAARGLDVEGISHVINYDLPNVPESYVHRIGRTARAGASGLAISFCDRDEVPLLRDIERLIGARVSVAGDRIGLPPEVLDPGPLSGPRRTGSEARPAGPPSGGGGRRRRRR